MITVRKFGVIVIVLLVLTLAPCADAAAPGATKAAGAASAAATAEVAATKAVEVKAAAVAAKVAATERAAGAHPHVSWEAVAGSSGSLWLLGDYRCATGSCFTIMRSTNGGATFVRVAYPAASQPLSQPQDVGDEPFWFANAEDGYLYVSSATFGLYWTEDGGKMWRLVQPGGPLAWRNSPLGGPLASPIVTTEGRAYVLVFEGCSEYRCKSLDLASSAVTSDTWTTTRLAVHPTNNLASLAAFGSKVWLIAVGSGGGKGAVLVSEDGGKSFSGLPSTGLFGIFCRASATSATTLWGFCGTGNFGYGVRSVDGGSVFQSLRGTEAPNGSSILPITNNEAVFCNEVSPNVWLTRDGGGHFSSVLHSAYLSGGGDMAFVSTTTWLVLGVLPTGGSNALWRTTTGGRSWQPVKLPKL